MDDVWVVVELADNMYGFVGAVLKNEQDAITEAKRIIETKAEERKQKYFISNNQRTFKLFDNSYTVEVVRKLV